MKPASSKSEPPQSWQERLAALRNVPPLLKMVWQTNRRLVLGTLLLRCIIAFTPVANLLIFRRIINAVVHGARHQTLDKQHLWMLLGLSLGISLISGGAARLVGLLDSLLGDQFTHAVSLKIMNHATSLDLVSFEDPVFYDKMDRARRQASSRLSMLTAVVAMGRQTLTLISMLAVVALFSPLLLLLLLAGTIAIFLNETKFAMLNYSMLYRRTPERRQLDYIRYLGSSSQSAKEVKIFGLGNYLAGRLGGLFERLYRENKQLAVKRTIHSVFINLVPAATHYAAYAFILFRAVSGTTTAGDVGLSAIAFFRAGDLMEDVVSRLADISGEALYVKDLFDYFATQPVIVSSPHAFAVSEQIRCGFEFENVSFRYPGSETLVLDNVSFRLRPGERVALVGENGAGKTTLVKLLARLYDPCDGRILLDGRDLRDYQVEDLRRQIGVIFQDYMKYEMTVAENIGLGQVGEIADLQRIQAAAEKSLAGGVIEKLPHGYEQMLGRRFEGGVNLSMGQWQKIALARAYMRDSQVLILDEPTASLDARAEFEVYRRFAELTGGKIVILISHRFSTVRMADHILVLAAGRIVEQGSHQELVAHGGKYAELFEFQASGYR